MNGLRVFGISSLPLHPGAPDERRARLEGGRATVLPHPDETLRLVVEENARLFPDRWTQPEASLAELRGQAAPGDTHSGNAPAFLRTA